MTYNLYVLYCIGRDWSSEIEIEFNEVKPYNLRKNKENKVKITLHGFFLFHTRG